MKENTSRSHLDLTLLICHPVAFPRHTMVVLVEYQISTRDFMHKEIKLLGGGIRIISCEVKFITSVLALFASS